MRLSRSQRKALAAHNFDLFDQTGPVAVSTAEAVSESAAEPVPLPSVEDLYALYERYNNIFFGGRLPQVRIEYSTRMRCAGSYTPAKGVIRIGRKYHELFPEEVGDTLKHEMIHILHFRHDAAFKAEAARIGASIRARAHPSLRKPPRYVYVCGNCGREYPRQKRLRMASCGACSRGGRFDARHKLRLKKR